MFLLNFSKRLKFSLLFRKPNNGLTVNPIGGTSRNVDLVARDLRNLSWLLFGFPKEAFETK